MYYIIIKDFSVIFFISSKLKTVSSCCLLIQGNLLLGTEGGSVYFFNISSFTLTDKVILQDLIPQG